MYVYAFSTVKISFTILAVSGKHRKVNRELVKLFEEENPGIEVELLEGSNSRYHGFIENKDFLEHDVVWWFSGVQLSEMAEAGFVEPINDIWEENKLYEKFEQASGVTEFNGRVYGIPLSHYHWGIYYSKEIFRKHKLKEAKTWDELIELCEQLKKLGIRPFAAGIKDNWTASAWFSYLNLRLNGLEFHHNLLIGKESFLDKRVSEVFEKWKYLIDKRYFIITMDKNEWISSIPYLHRGRAAMTLIGNFLFSHTPEKYIEDFGFFRFPILKENYPVYEERPTDVLFISSKSKNKEAAKKFLLFMSKAEIQEKFNNPQGYISPNKFAASSNELMIHEGKETLNSARGFSQFFDRDTSKTMAEISFEIFGNFMRNPDIKKAQNDLEEASLRIFNRN